MNLQGYSSVCLVLVLKNSRHHYGRPGMICRKPLGYFAQSYLARQKLKKCLDKLHAI